MEHFARLLTGKGLDKAVELPAACTGRRVRLAGWLLTSKTVTTARYEAKAFSDFQSPQILTQPLVQDVGEGHEEPATL